MQLLSFSARIYIFVIQMAILSYLLAVSLTLPDKQISRVQLALRELSYYRSSDLTTLVNNIIFEDRDSWASGLLDFG